MKKKDLERLSILSIVLACLSMLFSVYNIAFTPSYSEYNTSYGLLEHRVYVSESNIATLQGNVAGILHRLEK